MTRKQVVMEVVQTGKKFEVLNKPQIDYDERH